ncbi:ribose-phosphate pyrophosphokinase [Patescibacteria group bacterium]|nr:MAG: ribose-phosphate pyrophosphokinase [Patescibacteria group bacterium]
MKKNILMLPGAERAARLLARGLRAPVFKVRFTTFPDGEPRVVLPSQVKKSFLLVAPSQSNFETVWQLLMAIRAAKDNGLVAEVFFPILPLARADKALPGEPKTGFLFADCLTAASPAAVYAVSPHSAAVWRAFKTKKIVFEPLLSLAARVAKNWRPDTILAPDRGAAPRARKIADKLRSGLAVAEKIRDSRGRVRLLKFKGRIGRRVLIVDDLVSTGATLFTAAVAAKKAGAREIRALVVHVTPARELGPRLAVSSVQKLFVSDTGQIKKSSKIHVLPILEEIGRTLRRLNRE